MSIALLALHEVHRARGDQRQRRSWMLLAMALMPHAREHHFMWNQQLLDVGCVREPIQLGILGPFWPPHIMDSNMGPW
jgi:hypothetical protein